MERNILSQWDVLLSLETEMNKNFRIWISFRYTKRASHQNDESRIREFF
ncbi:MAG: hypothetical protein ACRESZ_06845 [Methylococcales bacterium]